MTPFQILGLPEHAGFEEVRKKFLSLAKKYHPDNGGNSEDFTKITNAYNALEKKFKKNKKSDFFENNKTYTSKKNDFVKDIKVSIPIKNFLLGPTIEIILGSDKENKPVIINVNNSLRKVNTEIMWDKNKKNIQVKIVPKSTSVYKIVDDYHLLLKCFMGNDEYNKEGQISVPYPTGVNIAVHLTVKPCTEPLQLFKGLGLPMENGEKGNMIIQFINKEKRLDALRTHVTDTGIPIGMPIAIESILR